MRQISILFIFIYVSIAVKAQTVPSQYQAIYDNLNTQISTFDSAVRSSWNGAKSTAHYAPQLLAASSVNYTSLLQPYYYQDVVIPQLDAIQALGADAVTVHIDFPVLYQPFYGSNTALYQQFVSFYQQLIAEVRSRNMKMAVETVVGVPFAGNLASSFTEYLQGLSWTQYMTGRAQNALQVAQLVAPDYLSLITEPDTEATSSGQSEAGTVNGSTQLLQTMLATLSSANVKGVVLGAGAGTWIESLTSYISNFTATDIQYIDMHVYPVNGNDFMNLLTVAPSIHAAGKQIAISECWAYKVSDQELGRLGPTQLFGRDPFSFWAPVDSAFLNALVDYANADDLAFLAPFWSHYLAVYLDYDTWGSKSSNRILNESYTAANDANIAGVTTTTGLAWMAATVPGTDSVAPSAPPAPAVSSVGTTTLQLSWSPATDNIGVASYHIYQNGSLLTTNNEMTLFVMDLVSGAQYTYTVSAFDASGNESAQSAPVTVQTVNITPPSVPNNLKVTSVSTNSASLSWTASTGIGGVGGYYVLRGTSASAMTIHSSTTSTTWSDSYCSPSTTYYYAVESYNPNHIASSPSKTVKTTTTAK